ncbi:TnsD family Tn7-like transposition protein [Acinetobacter towneri]|uniref:TnsD family Tn7-like transposition protein n=1 Tax=Acinetobacter towneri TaxID=202956 RepID=UPI001CE160DF|nr:TnsD family Tn7-like transposition protein [Acinetobacter towneri]MCA4789940.1 TniQ family protein [Acinetobacter towneri]
MLNFPMPYQNELIYSTVARAGIRLALSSPKQLLDEIFQNRKVIATVDLPCHLNAIINQFPSNQLSLEDIAYQHTLFPIYAPFVPEDRRQQCLQWMAEISQGSIHLALGINASRLKPIHKLRYCPSCFKEQLELYSELYWSRLWQIQGACCPIHGELIDSTIELRSLHRHNFVTPTYQTCPPQFQSKVAPDSLFITNKLLELLSLPSSESPSFEQWTMFYHQLAQINHCIRGQNQVRHDKTLEKIRARWSTNFLKQYNLGDLESETSWLRNIFRKHRKSFSYLEHIIAIEALSNKEWTFSATLEQVKKFNKELKGNNSLDSNIYLHPNYLAYREKWLKLVQELGIKPARTVNKALYAWLYRNDKDWLLSINITFHKGFIPQGTKIDWHKRDLTYTRQLIALYHNLIWDVDSPRRSAKWLIKQISPVSTIEKNLEMLPITSIFLKKYSEDIGTYQIRRLTKVFIEMKIKNETFPRWIILRKAGLSDERMLPETKRFLLNVFHDQRLS